MNPALGNPERNSSTSMMIVRRVLEYIDQAVSTLSLSIAEAMLTFGEKRYALFHIKPFYPRMHCLFHPRILLNDFSFPVKTKVRRRNLFHSFQ